MLDSVQLNVHAERIRTGDVLGRSKPLRRLFDFLVSCSAAGRAPKEIEVAIDVFDKGVDFEPSQDALVRVYIHKLRRKLEEYYAGAGSEQEQRLIIPKGEYRLVFEAAPVISAKVVRDTRRTSSFWKASAIALLVTLANVAIWLVARPAATPALQELAQVQANPVWASVLAERRPTYVVVGDYYLFGERDERSWQVRRLVREFDVNSRNELQQYVTNNPQFAERYTDLSLQYLPTSVGFALQSVLPVLRLNREDTPKAQVVLASDITPTMIKEANIVYIGLLSGLHSLEKLAFAGSRFQIGYTYDELVDRHTQRHYVSQAGGSLTSVKHRDFGYFSSFVGPGGNRIVILAGTRDVALMHIAETLTHPERLEQLTQRTGGREEFEALYSVEAVDGLTHSGRLIFSDRLTTIDWWNEVVR